MPGPVVDDQHKAREQAARELAGYFLGMIAARVCTDMVAFTSWMIVGFAAILGIMIANLEAVARFMDLGAFAVAIKLFLVAGVLHVIQRFFAGMVIAAGAVLKDMRDTPWTKPIDGPTFLAELEKAIFRPMRWLVRSVNRKAIEGDIVAGPRLHARLAQIQGWLTVAQVLVVGGCAIMLANSLAS